MNSNENEHKSLFDTIVFSLKQQNLNYFVQLVRVAMVDGVICERELKLLQQIGKRIKLTNADINHYIETNLKNDYLPPLEFSKRFEQVYFVVKMALIDGKIDKNEMRLANNFAVKSGFNENDIQNLLGMFVNGIKQNKSVEELFESYKKDENSNFFQ